MTNSVNVSFEITGVAPVSQMLSKVASNIQDLRPAWAEISREFYKTEQEIFAAEGAWKGHERWQALSPAWLKYKQKHGYSSRILVRIGRLKNSLAMAGTANAIFHQYPSYMIIGTNVPYAKYHQRSPKRGKKGQKNREFIWRYAGQKEQYADIIRKSVLRKNYG